MHRIQFCGRTLFVKRDDLIHKQLSGNKYRKLFALLREDTSKYKVIISYGGSQSNAMLALAAACHLKGWEFHYVTKVLSHTLASNPQGNLRESLALGMQLTQVHPVDYQAAVEELKQQNDCDVMVVHQGGAEHSAEIGIKELADEISAWIVLQGVGSATIVLPSGTGTTAAYLACHLPTCKIVTTAVVGHTDYLKRQITRLIKLPSNLVVLETGKNYRFAQPHDDLLMQYRNMFKCGIEVDYLYATVMLQALSENLETLVDEPLLYVHTGGLTGNATMAARYAFSCAGVR